MPASANLFKNTNLNDVSRKVILVLCGYLLRNRPENALIADLQDKIVEYASLLLNGLLQIAQSRNWIRPAVQIIDAMQVLNIKGLLSNFISVSRKQSPQANLNYCNYHLLIVKWSNL